MIAASSSGEGTRETGRLPACHSSPQAAIAAARAARRPLEEGGTRGKHGFPRGSGATLEAQFIEKLEATA